MPKIKAWVMITKGTIALVLIILTIGYISYSASQKSPREIIKQPAQNNNATNLPKQQNPPENAVKPEPVKVRYVSGIIKEVNKSSIVITDSVTIKETEVGFDKTTKILVGEGVGKDAAISDLAVDWNAAIFLSENKNNNIAQVIHLVVKNK